MKWSILIFAFILVFAIPHKGSTEPMDLLIGAPHMVKVVYGAFMMAEVVRVLALNVPYYKSGAYDEVGPDPVAFATQEATSAALSAALALPSSFVLANAIKGNAESTTFWRRVAFFVDGSIAVGLIGAGIYWSLPENLPKQPAEIYGWGGLLYFLASIPYVTASALDLIPFSFERK